MPKMINVRKGNQRLYGNSDKPVKYSSVPTRYAGLHFLQAGAEFNEERQEVQPVPGELPNDWNRMNIRSGVNVTDCPSRFGIVNKGLQNIGGMVFTADNIIKGWIRNKGEA